MYFSVEAKDTDGKTVEIPFGVRNEGKTVIFTVAKSELAASKCDTMLVKSDLTSVKSGTSGYMFFPTNFYYGYALCRFDEKQDVLYKSWPSGMPAAGICGNEGAVFVRIAGGDYDARFFVESAGGVYSLSPEFKFDGDGCDDDVCIEYTLMPYADYSDMAKFYREYQMRERGCKTLRYRAERRDVLRRAADCLELRIRMGWKPCPTPVRHQTLENEPPMKVACNIEQLNKIIDAMKNAGIDKAEICLVGWGPGGHDGRFPQQYPSDERFGGDDELRKFIARAQKMGYLVVPHTVSCGAYEIADNFDRDLLTMKKDADGNLYPYVREHYIAGGLNGGEPYSLCARTAYEQYAIKDLPVVRGYGFYGMTYIDEFSAIIPEKCYHPDHPVSRKQAREYFRRTAVLARRLFGGYQCEGYMDFMNADIDAILYTGVQSKLTHDMNPLFDEGIPFWQLVYHGIVMSNATSQTVNYPIKEKYQRLKFIEYGGRPLMYFYSKFGDEKNWMGDLDLHCESDDAIRRSVDAIKKAYDEYEELKYLQYEFMDRHEKLSEGVYRTTYSDGTEITVDYNEERYIVKNADGIRTVKV